MSKSLGFICQHSASLAEFLGQAIESDMTDTEVKELISYYKGQTKYQLVLGYYIKTLGDNLPTYILIEPQIDDKNGIYMIRVAETTDLKSRPSYHWSEFEKVADQLKNGFNINNLDRFLVKTKPLQYVPAPM